MLQQAPKKSVSVACPLLRQCWYGYCLTCFRSTGLVVDSSFGTDLMPVTGIEDTAMTPQDAQRVVRRLAAAEGYLELGMAARAIVEIESVKSSGPFEAIAELLRGEALKSQDRFDEAIPALNRAAELFPEPFNQRALLGLSQCYRQRGDIALADETAAAANTPDQPEGAILDLLMTPIFQVQIPNKRRPPAKG